MSKINMNRVIGDTFEDMSIAEMMIVQGSGDVEPDTIFSTSAVLTEVMSSCAYTVFTLPLPLPTIKGKC